MPEQPTEQTIVDEIVRLVEQRGEGKTICPSEVARSLCSENWRELMEPIRTIATRMAKENQLRISQKGVTVDLENCRGPVRFGLPEDSPV